VFVFGFFFFRKLLGNPVQVLPPSPPLPQCSLAELLVYLQFLYIVFSERLHEELGKALKKPPATKPQSNTQKPVMSLGTLPLTLTWGHKERHTALLPRRNAVQGVTAICQQDPLERITCSL